MEEAVLLVVKGCKGEDGELSVVTVAAVDKEMAEMVEELGLVMDCCIGEGKVLVVLPHPPTLIPVLLLVVEPATEDSEQAPPGGLEADDDNWQLFVFVHIVEDSVGAAVVFADDIAEAAEATEAALDVVVAKLLGGFEGIGSTCQTNKNIIIIWPNKLYGYTVQRDFCPSKIVYVLEANHS